MKSVDLTAGEQERAEVTQVLAADRARRAAAAGWDEPEGDVIAGLDAQDARADLDHLAGAFVATDDRELLESRSSFTSGGMTMSPVTRCSSE